MSYEELAWYYNEEEDKIVTYQQNPLELFYMDLAAEMSPDLEPNLPNLKDIIKNQDIDEIPF